MLLSQTDTSFISLSSSASFLSYSAWFCYSFSYSAITVSNSSVPFCVSPPRPPSPPWEVTGCGSACHSSSCCAGFVFELLSGCSLWWTGSAWLALLRVDCPWLCLCRRCRGASITLSVSTSAIAAGAIVQRLILESASIFGHSCSQLFDINREFFFFKCCQHFKEVSLHSV